MMENCNLSLYGNRKLFEELFQVLNHKHEKKKETNDKNTIEIKSNNSTMNIFTKYYETIVNLNFINNISTQLNDQTNGLVIYFDDNQKFLEDLEEKKEILKSLSAEKYLKLILVENLNSLTNKTMLDKLTDEHDFNIIELNLQNEDKDQEEEEEDSVEELINALFVHEWPIMKKVGEIAQQNINVESTEGKAGIATAAEEENNEKFEDILSNLHEMRAKALNMDPNERKLFAQDLVTKFWNSIGGDPDELEGLSDSSDHE